MTRSTGKQLSLAKAVSKNPPHGRNKPGPTSNTQTKPRRSPRPSREDTVTQTTEHNRNDPSGKNKENPKPTSIQMKSIEASVQDKAMTQDKDEGSIIDLITSDPTDKSAPSAAGSASPAIRGRQEVTPTKPIEDAMETDETPTNATENTTGNHGEEARLANAASTTQRTDLTQWRCLFWSKRLACANCKAVGTIRYLGRSPTRTETTVCARCAETFKKETTEKELTASVGPNWREKLQETTPRNTGSTATMEGTQETDTT